MALATWLRPAAAPASSPSSLFCFVFAQLLPHLGSVCLSRPSSSWAELSQTSPTAVDIELLYTLDDEEEADLGKTEVISLLVHIEDEHHIIVAAGAIDLHRLE